MPAPLFPRLILAAPLDVSACSAGTLLTPVVGVLATAPALHGPLGARELVALSLTVGGVALAIRG